MNSSLMKELAKLSWRHEVPERKERYAKLTEGITNPRDRRITEALLEQQSQHLDALEEAGTADATGDVALFQRHSLGIIPRVYPSLFIKDLISIQPMPLPTAKVFYKDFVRFDNQNNEYALHNVQYFSRTYANRGTVPNTQPFSPLAPDSQQGALPSTSGPNMPTGVPQVSNEGTAPKRIKMKITSADVTVYSKALEYEFSAELDQDLMAYHGLSADPELGAEAAQEIQREIEYDIIDTLVTYAGAGNVNWSAVSGLTQDAALTINQLAYNKTLFNAVVDARNLVFKKRYTYPNWLVTHPDFAVRLEKLNGFEYDKSFNPAQITQGRQFFGTIRGVINIYVDPWFPNPALAVLGYKGAGDFDIGLAYCPYIPFYATAPFQDPSTLQTRRALLTRQAIAMFVPECYSTITITNPS